MVKRMLCLVIGIMFLFGGNGDCGVLTGGDYAVKPVGDGLIGQVNNSSKSSRTANTLYYTQITATTAGTISNSHIYTSLLAGDSAVALFETDGTYIEGSYFSSSFATGWQDNALSSSAIIEGKDYLLGVCASTDTSWTLYTNTLNGTTLREIAMTYSNPLPSFDPAGSSLTDGTRGAAIIFDTNAGSPA